MESNQIKDIEVAGATDVTANLIEEAKTILRNAGYFVDNLWQTEDVTMNYNCTEEEAQEVLYGALTNDATYQQIWEAISYEAEAMKLERNE